jgi:hypothetical protein
MPWVRFSADYPWHQRHNVTVMYRAGGTYLVKQNVADAARAKGVAELTKRPEKSDGDDARG